jgi:hypothetical protein
MPALYGYLMAKRAPKAQITDYDREYLSKLLEQSTANARKATEQANKLFIGYLIDQYLPFFTLSI